MVHRRDDKVLDQVVGTGVMEEVRGFEEYLPRMWAWQQLTYSKVQAPAFLWGL